MTQQFRAAAKVTTAERMGVAGNPLPDRILHALHSGRVDSLNRDEKLALAWALVDQASSLRTTREAKRAMDAIEDLYDAEEEAPDTTPTGECPTVRP